MPTAKQLEDQNTLRMALVGYQVEKRKIADKIAEIEAKLAGGPAAPEVSKAPAPRKRVLSAAARARIAAAQKKRWAEHRKRLARAK